MDELVAFVARELRVRGDAADARAMAAYMKTDMPFYGVKKPAQALVMRDVMRRFPLASRGEYQRAVRALWRQPHREEKYLAIELAGRYRRYVTLSSVPLYRQMVVQGAWWDLVDGIAADLIGHVLQHQRPRMSAILDEWIDGDDLWLRRTALIAQLRHKGDTDEERLFRYCLARAHERDFFIRKAIGWALREYAKIEPEAVRAFVLEHAAVWSGLTYREATKHLDVPPR